MRELVFRVEETKVRLAEKLKNSGFVKRGTFNEIDSMLRYNINPLNAKFTKWPNTLKQFVGKLLTNCLSVFGHFVGLAFKGLK